MTDHPITPPPELKAKWMEEDEGGPGVIGRMIDRSAQWGYDQRGEVNEAKLQQARNQDLKACCALMDDWGLDGNDLMECRRPKPPSLKEQACKLLECYGTSGVKLTADQCNTIRKALENSND